MDFLKKNFIFIIVFCLFLIAVKPLVAPGLFPMHDDTQPTRVYEMTEALKDGQFPVRWVEHMGYGYGYPIFNFYAPLPYYVGAFGMFTGLNALTATKVMFALGALLAGIAMFFLGREMWGDLGGSIAGLLYMYAPYHAVQIYVRGAVAEYWAYGFLPLLALGIILWYKRKQSEGVIIGSLGLAGIVLSHNITALLVGIFLAFLFLFLLFLKKDKKSLVVFSCLILLGLGLSAFFWMPAVFESTYTKVSSLITGANDYHQHFLYLDQLWDSPWGFAGSAPGRADGMSFMLGKISIVLAAFVVVYSFWGKIKKTKFRNQALVFLLLSGLAFSIFMTLPQSLWLWERLPILSYVQYPWRFLVFACFFLSFIAGAFPVILKELIKNTQGCLFILGCITVLLLYKGMDYFRPQFIEPRTNEYYTEQRNVAENISSISDEYLPKDFPTDVTPIVSDQDKIMISDGIIVKESDVRSHFLKFVFSAETAAEIVVSVARFPGWTVVLDTVPVASITESPVFIVPVSQGEHTLTLFFKDTPVRLIGNGITFISFIIMLIFVAKGVKKYEEK